MYLLYDIILHILFISLLPYFFFKALFIGKYRAGLLERFGFIKPWKLSRLQNARVVWFHAVSVGETKAAIPLLRMLKDRHPETKVVFSTVTATGNDIASRDGEGLIDVLIFFPLDFSWVVKRVTRRLRPLLFIVVEKEIWPNLFRLLNARRTPTIVVNGNISDRSFKRYKRFRLFFNSVFKEISAYCAQSELDSAKASALGIRRTLVTGNMKFDIRMPSLGEKEKDALKGELGIMNSERVIVAGSTHRGEEEIILSVYKELCNEFKRLRLVIAPRHPERFKEVGELIEKKGFSLLRRSEQRANSNVVKNNSSKPRDMKGEVILLDTMGELGRFYGIADIVFVGGSLVEGVGGHNLLEPAIYRRPVVYGPYLGNWLYVAEMLERSEGGIRVADGEALFDKITRLLSDPDLAEGLGEAAYKVACENRGATEKSLQIIEGFLYA
ncbi:MAG: 3-deoxy-D-manno-octulosonic acid transferase [Thermodesulfobacteriota bacterium]